MDNKTSLAPFVTHCDPKGRKFMSIVEQAYDKASLSEGEAQKVNESTGLATLIGNFLYQNRRSDISYQEVPSSYIYPEGYQIRPIEEQVVMLKKIFPLLNGANLRIAEQPLPEGAEGWFAIPRWKRFGATYDEAFEYHVLPKCQVHLKNFRSFLKGKLSGEYPRQLRRSEEMFERAVAGQAGYDIKIIPAQFGLRHRGCSADRARERFSKNEFGLGVFAVGCLTLIHPERFQRWEQLHVICAGDEYDLDARNWWLRCPFLYFSDNQLTLEDSGVGYTSSHFGAASAFIPNTI